MKKDIWDFDNPIPVKSIIGIKKGDAFEMLNGWECVVDQVIAGEPPMPGLINYIGISFHRPDDKYNKNANHLKGYTSEGIPEDYNDDTGYCKGYIISKWYSSD